MESPLWASLWANSFTMFSHWVLIIASGISIVDLSMIFWIASSSFVRFASSSFWTSKCFFKSSLYSSKVLNSDTSCANSSFNSGSSFAFTSWILTLNNAGFPAKSAAWYFSGNVTFTSTSSPAFFPTNWSWEPISSGWFSPLPPSNATPSTNPSKSITAVSPSAIGLSVTVTVLEFFCLSFSSSAATSSSDTVVSIFVTCTPLYLPSFTSGLTATSAVKMKGLPASICTTSIVGLETTSTPLSSTACA